MSRSFAKRMGFPSTCVANDVANPPFGPTTRRP